MIGLNASRNSWEQLSSCNCLHAEFNSHFYYLLTKNEAWWKLYCDGQAKKPAPYRIGYTFPVFKKSVAQHATVRCFLRAATACTPNLLHWGRQYIRRIHINSMKMCNALRYKAELRTMSWCFKRNACNLFTVRETTRLIILPRLSAP